MKKKIIFMIINMNIGGTEKALLNMISEIPNDHYEITILMLEEYGGFLKYIPSHVHVKYLNEYNELKDIYNLPSKVSIVNYLKNGKVLQAITFFWAYLLSKLKRDRNVFLKYLFKDYALEKEHYDIAVAYAGPMDLISYFVLNKIEAKIKVQWVHFDITKIGFDRISNAKIYKRFHKIFVVSHEGCQKLVNMIPSLKEKTEVFPNIISTKLIDNQVKEGSGFIDNFTGLRILTVGRLTSEKGYDLAIRAFSRLMEDGYDAKWYCIGEGSLREKYESLIREYKLEGKFILLGADSNPYSYINQCDIYVQPSRHEGYCITLAEARCLNKPIVTTNFTGAREQIKHGKTGLIVDINENDIYLGVKEMIDNPDLRIEFNINLSNEIKNNNNYIEKIYNLA